VALGNGGDRMSTDTRTWDFWCSIHESSPRYAAWAKVFDDPKHVPITTPIAERVQLPIGIRQVLFVKVTLLSDDERQRMVQHLAERFSVAPEDVVAELERDPDRAVPILGDDVSITVLHPQKWLDDEPIRSGLLS
jgi:hypothetical protein